MLDHDSLLAAQGEMHTRVYVHCIELPFFALDGRGNPLTRSWLLDGCGTH